MPVHPVERYGNRAGFIHVEVWKYYEQATLNTAYDTWANRSTNVGLTEGGKGRDPWIFLINADGKIAKRFNNVPDVKAIEGWLAGLPAGWTPWSLSPAGPEGRGRSPGRCPAG